MITKRQTNILKGFAILAVIWNHTKSCTSIMEGSSLLTTVVAFTKCHAIGMGLFLFLSGYGIFKSYNNSGLDMYWEKKIKKIMIPFYCIQIVLLIVNKLLNRNLGTPAEKLSSVIGINPRNVFDSSMWYISYTLFLYFTFWVVFSLFRKERAAVCYLPISIFIAFITPKVWENGWMYSAMFPIGVYISYFEEKLIKEKVDRISSFIQKVKSRFSSRATGITIILAILIPLLVIWRITSRSSQLMVNIFIIIGAFLTIVAVMIIDNGKNLGILEKIGTVSYMLYLLEMKTIVNPLGFIAGFVDTSSFIIGPVLFCIVFTVNVFLAILLSKLFDTVNKKLFIL